MITASDIYWITRLDCIYSLLVGLSIFTVVPFFAAIFFLGSSTDSWWDDKEKSALRDKGKKLIVFSSVWLFSCLTINTFIPSSSTAIAMYTIPAVVNNEQVQELPINVLNLVNSKMKDWYKEIGIEDVDKYINNAKQTEKD